MKEAKRYLKISLMFFQKKYYFGEIGHFWHKNGLTS